MRTPLPLILLAATIATPLVAQAHWTRLYPNMSPSRRSECGVAFDAVRGRTIVFGGDAAPGDELWQFDGTTWSLATQPLTRPQPRLRAAMCFDEQRGVAVLHGGLYVNLTSSLSDTWEWNGATWIQRTPNITTPTNLQPSARRDHAMAYDRERGRSVLFGGNAAGVGPNNQTWEWDGTSWQRCNPVHAPPPRTGGKMCFDPTSGGLLLFGGDDSVVMLDDTWRWNGVDWQQMFPATPPLGRIGHAMVTDLARRRVVMFGGGNDLYAWEWDGTQWSPRYMASPAARGGCGLAYDTGRCEVVLFGGSHTQNDTWVYRTDLPADFAPLGAGCAGSLGTAELAAAPYSLPWLGDTFVSGVTPVAANGPAFFVTGFAAATPAPLAPYGMPGCTLFVSPLATKLEFATAAGVASWSLAIPGSTALAGVVLAQQCLLLDSGNAAGVVVSSARTLRIGVR